MEKTNEKSGFFSHFKNDLLGGVTAGVVALPLALAFGLSSGLGPDAGLYGAIFIAFFAALFGGTATQISGPTAPMTAVSMVVVAGIVQANNGNVEQALPAILTVFLLGGLLQIGLGVIGVGKYIKFMPYPVVSGFMTAIGVIILVTQLLPALGYYPAEDMTFINKFKPQAEEVLLDKILKDEAGEGILVLEDFKETIKRAENITENDIVLESTTLAKGNSSGVLGTLKVLPRALSNINYIELILALITILIIYGFKRITTKVPSTLVALFVVSVAAYVLQSMGVLNYRPIPEIPSGIPMPKLEIITGFNFAQVQPYILTALTLAMLGSIDSLLTSVVADNMTKTRHNPNKELIGQGIGNSIASIFGGIPGAGATIRTVVNINAGGKTRLSGMISGVLLLFILLALGPVASQIPAAVLAGILITVGINVMDYKGLKSLGSWNKAEIFIMLIVLVLSVFWNLVYAVGVGLVIAALVFMKKMGDLTTNRSEVKDMDKVMAEESWSDEMNFPVRFKEEVFIKHIDGPLFFGYTNDFQNLAYQIPSTASHVIIRMDRTPYIDQSGLYTLEDVLLNLNRQDIEVLIVGLNEQPRGRMEAIDIIPDLISENHLFDNFEECVRYVKSNVKDVV